MYHAHAWLEHAGFVKQTMKCHPWHLINNNLSTQALDTNFYPSLPNLSLDKLLPFTAQSGFRRKHLPFPAQM